MTDPRKFVWWTVWLALLFMSGCQKKTASLPPQKQAPTVAVVLPDEMPLAEVPEESPAPIAQEAPVQAPAKAKPKKPTRSSTSSVKKSSPPSASGSAVTTASPPPQPQPSGTQTVATLRPPRSAEAGPETALAAAVPDAQLLHQKEDTARMVDATENALKGINRSLSDDEKSMRSQIQSYLQQSRKATADGDYERAYNLAKKAQLLADALVKK